MPIELDLTGKVCLVTGAGHGLGRTVALTLARAGAACAIVDKDADSARSTADQIRATGAQAIGVSADVTREADVRNAFARCVDELGGVSVLVNNVGIYPHSHLLELPATEWDEVFAVNVKSYFLCSREAARRMVEQGGGGRIVNIASIDAFFPEPRFTHYDASKGAVVALTRSMAVDLAAYRITVNAVGPGLVDTPLLEREAPLRKKAFLEHVPLGYIGGPEEQANAVLFFASDAARWITGQTLYVDGGVQLAGYMTGVDE